MKMTQKYSIGIKHRGIALLLALAMCLQFVVLPTAVFAADHASSTTSVVQNDVYVDIVKKLEDADNGVFKLTLDAGSYIKSEYLPNAQAYSEDGFYVIEKDGYYLVELWGGEGADGDDSITTDNKGGIGGDAGYVYGYMYLKKGQTLLFTVGTNGKPASTFDEGGGGANEGGNHETWSSYKVGGGGGYSAVYLFNNTKYSFSLTEQERLTNYIMIAAGGGGGGAAANLFETSSGRPDGGRGGHITRSLTGYLSENDNNGVAGTYFAGSDGRSSGTSTAYVGKGGTNVPGAMPKSWIGWQGVINPNDWTGTYEDGHVNTDAGTSEAGGGGMGARRGGAGGAGFCGGSGGFQADPFVSATNIGGGGGGSSFIADATVTGEDIIWANLPSSISRYLNDVNRNSVGGSCVITFLGEETPEENVDTSHMQDVDIEGSISSYFDILSVISSSGDVSVSGSDIRITGANIAPDEAGYPENSAKVEILIRAKAGFAGGNNVPVIGKGFTVTPVDHAAIIVKADATTDYANVPLLGFDATGNSYMSNEPEKEYATSSLYTDNYVTARSELNSNNWKYAFLSEIGAYEVLQGGSKVTASTVKPQSTTEYTVQFTVRPKTSTGVAVVGKPVVDTVFQDTATITIVEADLAGTLNEIEMDATKFLSYSGNAYQFGLQVNQRTAALFVPDTNMSTSSVGPSTWTVPATGWYYVQAWGGNGGSSGSATVTGVNGGNSYTAASATGGEGGYVSGYVYLTEGTDLFYSVGSAGTSGTSSSVRVTRDNPSRVVRGGAGGGGSYSYIQVGDNYLAIAGGGGGAGQSIAAISQHITLINTVGAIKQDTDAGKTPAKRTEVNTTINADMGTYNGKTGNAGTGEVVNTQWYTSCSADATGGTGGTAGSNYRHSALASGYDTTGSGMVLSADAKANAGKLSTSKTGNNGKVAITLVESEDSANHMEKLNGLTASGTMSRYFDIHSIAMTIASSTPSTVTNGDGSHTVTYANSSGVLTAEFTYMLTPNGDGTTSWRIYDVYCAPSTSQKAVTVSGQSGYNVVYSASPYFTFDMTPKDGFLGGNDVPFVQYGTTGTDDTGVQVAQGGVEGWLNQRDTSDYANVAISYDFGPDNLLTQNTSILCGEAVDQEDLLIANEIPMPTGSDAWKAEFVQAVLPETATVSPTQTTTYAFTQKVEPKAEASKAVVVSSVSPVEYTQTATVTVGYTVTDRLSKLTYAGPDQVAQGEGIVAKITPYGGYEMPSAISVSIGGAVLSSGSYTFDSQTGMLTIPASVITGNVVLSGTAVTPTYGIYYTYVDPVTGESVVNQETGHGGQWTAGEAVDPADLVVFHTLTFPEKPGHEFHWEWGTDDGQPITVMPASDLYVLGLYEPIVYTLTVHYQDAETGTPLAEDYVGKYYYEDTYSVVSPAVDGYMAEQTVISGTFGAGNVEITVNYTKTQGQLNIVYVYSDSQTEAVPTYTQTIQVDDTYEILSPVIDGYTADTPMVSGTVTGEQADSGITVYVTYDPNRYTVYFESAGGTLASGNTSKTVAFNAMYGFDPTQEVGQQYSALPTPLRNGYEFTGWYNANGELVTEETIVTETCDHTLTARWEGQEFTLTVRYQYSDNSKAAEDYVARLKYNESYNVPSPYIEGYTPAPDVVGTMGAGNKVIYVTYTIDVHTIRIHYIGPDGDPLTNDYSTEQDYGTAYHVPSPQVPGYELDAEKNGGDLSAVSGTVGTQDIEVYVYYKYVPYTLTVNYVIDPSYDDPSYDETLDLPKTKVIEGLHIGETYDETAPGVAGYTLTGGSALSGTFAASDITLTFTYRRNAHTLTVQYMYDLSVEDPALAGTLVPENTYTETVKYNSPYSVAVTPMEGYRTFRSAVEGTMPDEDVQVIVYYYDPETVLSVEVTWGDLNFTYDPGQWLPESHSYSGSFTPTGVNKVTVTNSEESTLNVIAQYSYASSSGYGQIDACFTATNDAAGTQKTQSASLSSGDSDEVWLWLEGNMPTDAETDIDHTVGVCTVTIEKGDP